MNLRFWRSEEKMLGDSWPLDTPPPADWPWQLLSAPEQAVGLPAVIAVIRLLAHSAALVPLIVVRSDENGIAQRATDTWQWRLLNRRPGPPPQTPFHFKADIAAQFSGRGNAYIRKYVASGTRVGEDGPRVTELAPLLAGRVKPRRQAGAIVFDDSSDLSSGQQTVTTKEIIQIRSFAFEGQGLEGLAPITAARYAIEAGLRRQQFEARHLANGIFPGIGFQWPAGVTKEQADRWIEQIEAKHQGSFNAGKMIFVGGGATVTPIPISLEDAQFAETTKLTLAQVAGMYQIPMSFITPGEREVPGDIHWRYFLTFALGPILEAMVQGLSSDEMLFPPDGEQLEVRAQSDALLNPDPLQKATVDHLKIQSGAKLVDEVRAANGDGPLPPIPDDWQQHPGQVPQITPVGGAPNPLIPAAGNPADNGGKE